jgi:hypothetical protein
LALILAMLPQEEQVELVMFPGQGALQMMG